MYNIDGLAIQNVVTSPRPCLASGFITHGTYGSGLRQNVHDLYPAR